MQILLNEHQKILIKNHALSEYPNEMCGFLTKDSFIPVKNISDNPRYRMKISGEDFYKYREDIVAVVHSHTAKEGLREIFDIRTPSYIDAQNQKISGVPWLIVGTEGINVTEPIQYPRVPNNDYLNRPFIWFINDCFTLVQDFLKFEKNITLSNLPIPENHLDYINKNNLVDSLIYNWNVSLQPFNGILEEGTVVLLDHAGRKRNHLGIYTKGHILHQGLRSVAEPIKHFKGRIREVFDYRRLLCE